MYNHGLTETNFNINEFKKDEIDFFTLHFKTKDCFDTRNMRLSSAYKKWSIALTRSVMRGCADQSLLQVLLILGVMQFTRMLYVS